MSNGLFHQQWAGETKGSPSFPHPNKVCSVLKAKGCWSPLTELGVMGREVKSVCVSWCFFLPCSRIGRVRLHPCFVCV